MKNKPYWDRLQAIIEAAKLLQASPIPDEEYRQRMNLWYLRMTEFFISRLLRSLKERGT